MRLEKPAGFTFKPGQAIRLAIPAGAQNASEEARVLSIASAPHEAEITVVTRLRDVSPFKQTLKVMPEGSELQIAGPLGNFIKQEDQDRPSVFLAGGIGITPFLSMLRDAHHLGQLNQTTLFYSNRTVAASAMLEELQDLDAANSGFRLVAKISHVDDSTDWPGETGWIDEDMLRRHLTAVTGPIYYIVGPGAFVSAMTDMLAGVGVNKDDIRLEQFSGY